ncbi:MAG: spore germination protein GerW family protein [Candidatus Promineifilaceae bacterium]|nr:spore germination protein GerW family protein [Candidatus Promineifilaceae bacterium]
MAKDFEMIAEKITSQAEASELLQRLVTVAHPSSVYSEPVESGDYTVITASEVKVGLGYGYGGGGGSSPGPAREGQSTEDNVGLGGGGGGGGSATARPVAAIEIGPHGVRVEPIIDPTKIAVAFLTTFLGMITTLRKARGK